MCGAKDGDFNLSSTALQRSHVTLHHLYRYWRTPVQPETESSAENPEVVTDTPAATGTSEAASNLLLLSPIEARLLGCLVEKAATTPEVYPLTLNAAQLACNQKTNRDPLMNLEPGAVGHALREMEDKGLVKVVHNSRALRYEHRIDSAYTVTTRQRALLCVMLLRGPQTLAELHTRTERLAQFPDLDEVRSTLDRLAQRSPALVVRLGRGPGQREDRYMHLLCGPVSAEQWNSAAASSPSSRNSGLEDRVDQLERTVEELRSEIAELRSAAALRGE